MPTAAGGPVPVILKGHGFGLSKEIAEDDLYQRLIDEGYAVLLVRLRPELRRAVLVGGRSAIGDASTADVLG